VPALTAALLRVTGREAGADPIRPAQADGKSISWLSGPDGRGASASASRRARPVSASIRAVAGWRWPLPATTGWQEIRLTPSTTTDPDTHRMTRSVIRRRF
jgi:hypothetical protein